MTEDVFADPKVGRGGAFRDQWDRPMLYPRGVSTRQPYSSASGLADYISNSRGIEFWKLRYLARGMGQREDLAALAGAEVYTTGFGMQDEGENKASGRRLDEIVERALDHARLSEKADYGTAAHMLTEPGQVERGGYVPTRMGPDVDEMNRLLAAVTILDTEVFVASDRFMAAGTFDHLVLCDGYDGALILDKKFGKNIKPGAWSVQTSVYATGDVYTLPESSETPDQRFTFVERYGVEVNQRWGLIASVVADPFDPADPDRPRRRGRLIPIDLTDGAAAAEHAVWTRDWQKRSDQMRTPLNVDDLTRRKAEALIADITTAEEAHAIWQQYQHVWTDRLTNLANARLTH